MGRRADVVSAGHGVFPPRLYLYVERTAASMKKVHLKDEWTCREEILLEMRASLGVQPGGSCAGFWVGVTCEYEWGRSGHTSPIAVAVGV